VRTLALHAVTHEPALAERHFVRVDRVHIGVDSVDVVASSSTVCSANSRHEMV
jgi:hypothetical protein